MAATGLGGENGRAVIEELAPCIPIVPAGRLVPEVIAILVLYKFCSRGNWILDQQILCGGSVHSQVDGERVAGHDWALQRLQRVFDLACLIRGHQLEVVAGQVERERALLVELLLGGIVLALHRPVGAPSSLLGHDYCVAAWMELRRRYIKLEVYPRGRIGCSEMPLADGGAVEQHIHVEIRFQLLRGCEIVHQAKEHHGCLLGRVPPVSTVAIEHQPLRCAFEQGARGIGVGEEA